MKKRISLLALFALSVSSLAAQTEAAGIEMDWEKAFFSLERGVLGTLVYAGIGILMLILAFKAKDILLPGNLAKQLVEEKNIAVAIVTAAFLLGISLIIAAAISS